MTVKIKKYLAALVAASLILSLAGCSLLSKGESSESAPESSESESSEPEPVDPNWPVMIGETEIAKKPETVVCLSPELAEHIGDLGMTDRLAAAGDYCDQPAALSSLPKAGTAQSPNYETIDQLSPDYVILQGQLAESDLVEMQQRNITVVSFPSAASTTEIYELLRELALFFDGKEDGAGGADQLIDRYTQGMDEITAAVKSYREASGAELKKAAYVRVLDYTMATGDTLEGELLGLVAENAADAGAGWAYPEDKWAEFAADILFVNKDVVIKDLEQNENYKGLKAVYGDAVYQVDMDAFARGGLRMLDILRSMAVTAWPEAFPEEEPLSPAYPSMYKEA